MALSATPGRPMIDISAMTNLTHDSDKTSIVLKVLSQSRPGLADMHNAANWVAVSFISTVQAIYRDVDAFRIDPEFITCVYYKHAGGYVMTIPTLLQPIVHVFPNFQVTVEGDNTITMTAEDYSASDKAKTVANNFCFGSVKGPAGACISDTDMFESVTSALAKTNMKVTKCHAVQNEMGMRKDFHAFHFDLPPPSADGLNPFMILPKLKADPPRTQGGFPLDISFSKAFCAHFKICGKCLKTNEENGGACTCGAPRPHHGPSAAAKKRDRDETFKRMMAKMQRH